MRAGTGGCTWALPGARGALLTGNVKPRACRCAITLKPRPLASSAAASQPTRHPSAPHLSAGQRPWVNQELAAMVAPGSGGMVAAARRKRQDPAAFREKLVRLMP